MVDINGKVPKKGDVVQFYSDKYDIVYCSVTDSLYCVFRQTDDDKIPYIRLLQNHWDRCYEIIKPIHSK